MNRGNLVRPRKRRKNRGLARTASSYIVALGLLGCSDRQSAVPHRADVGSAEGGAGGASGPGSLCELRGAPTDEDGNLLVVAQDRLNYAFQSSLEIRTVPVRAMSDLSFDWSEMTEDMFGHAFDPLQSVDMMELMIWSCSRDDLLRDLAADSPDTSNLVALGQLPTHNEIDAARLLEVRSATGGVVDESEMLGYLDTTVYAAAEHSYLVMIAEGSVFGQGTKMISFFEPTADEANTEVRLTNESTTLHYTADLTSLTRTAVPVRTADIVIDWSDDERLTHNAMGQPWLPTRISDVVVAHYLEETPSDLEDRFLDLELLADETYAIRLSAGQSVNLSRLTDANGEPFAGVDEGGTWIFALKCGSCANPAPWFLTILQPCP